MGGGKRAGQAIPTLWHVASHQIEPRDRLIPDTRKNTYNWNGPGGFADRRLIWLLANWRMDTGGWPLLEFCHYPYRGDRAK